MNTQRPFQLFRYCVPGLLVLFTVVSCGQREGDRLIELGRQSIEAGWKFKKGDVADAAQSGFDDSQWRDLSIPHDWQIEPHEFQDENHIGPFVKGIKDSTSTGNMDGGVGWYRKHFTLTPADLNRSVYVVFDGVSVQSDVWINGQHLGFHPNGYTQFYYNLTPHLVVGNNVLAVKSVNTGDNTRWYAGGGLYRQAWLLVSNRLYIEPQSLFVTTPQVNAEKSQVEIAVVLRNDRKQKADAKLVATIFDTDGQAVGLVESAAVCSPGSASVATLTVNVEKPQLWSPETPVLYNAEVRVLVEGELSDVKQTRFGIRTIDFTADKGFLLNGKETLLKGACIHHDNGLLGAATFNRAEYRKISLLKQNGFNAIRTSHNLPSTALLDACDELGMMVMDEAFDMWYDPKRPNDYNLYFAEWAERDIRSMVCRDRNHPSVIVWSIGNEIYERADLLGLKVAKRLKNTIKKQDTTRPVTQAICALWQVPEQEWDATISAFEILDVCGYNYEMKHYERDHRLFPNRVMIGTETHPRSAFENWQFAVEKSYVVGDFVWTGVDYIGEVGIGNTTYGEPGKKATPVRPWPWYLSFCGDIDLIGEKKPQSYYRDVVWGRSNLEMMVHSPIPEGKAEIISAWGWPDEHPHWNWPGCEGKPLKVSVYSPCDVVRLLLNGRLIEEKKITSDDKLTATFQLPYQSGELTAIALNDGKEVAVKSFVTCGMPHAIKLTAEVGETTTNHNDLIYIKAEVVDKDGNVVTTNDKQIHLSVKGSGTLLASGNASPDDLYSFRNPTCRTFRGRCMAIVQPAVSAGKVVLTATCEELPDASVSVEVKPQASL